MSGKDAESIPISVQQGDTTVRLRGETMTRLKLLRIQWKLRGMDAVIQRLLEPFGTLPELYERLSEDAHVREGLKDLAERRSDGEQR